ncbi:MAG: hypothetical protein IVW57_16235 [Ktedonobacterales bacterium]|nr:hypothetical protein [Ktedonobacterales bacterium]
MPTLGAACAALRLSRRTLAKWCSRLDIVPTPHGYDRRYRLLSDEEVRRVADARAQMPDAATRLPPSPRPRPHQPLSPAPPRPVTARTSDDASDAFRYRAQAARWLQAHGVNALTPKNWPGWREVALTRPAVLALAISLPRNHRRMWRLHPCDERGCVCHTMLRSS